MADDLPQVEPVKVYENTYIMQPPETARCDASAVVIPRHGSHTRPGSRPAPAPHVHRCLFCADGRFNRSEAEKVMKEVLEEKLQVVNERDTKGCACFPLDARGADPSGLSAQLAPPTLSVRVALVQAAIVVIRPGGRRRHHSRGCAGLPGQTHPGVEG